MTGEIKDGEAETVGTGLDWKPARIYPPKLLLLHSPLCNHLTFTVAQFIKVHIKLLANHVQNAMR